jgi:D-threo-aldose 1-dehydrogenase
VTAIGRPGAAVLTGTRLGLGCAQLGDLFRPLTDAEAGDVVAAAWDQGIRYFDTAPHYGVGLSEQRLGQALRGRPRGEFLVSTKAGRLIRPRVGPQTDVRGDRSAGFGRVWDFSRDGVFRSLEESLERLGLDRVDIVLLHDVGERYAEALRYAVPALAELREQGVVGAIGAGDGNARTLTRFATEADIDVVLEAGRYTLIDRTAEESLLPACAARGVAVIAAGVFNTGLLATPEPRPGAKFEYEEAGESSLSLARAMAGVCASHGVELPAAALQFPLRAAPVTTVVAGAETPAQIVQTATRFRARLTEEVWEDLDEARRIRPQSVR